MSIPIIRTLWQRLRAPGSASEGEREARATQTAHELVCMSAATLSYIAAGALCTETVGHG